MMDNLKLKIKNLKLWNPFALLGMILKSCKESITYHLSPITFSRGYTLVEVLIASSIFVGVILIGGTTFSTVNNLSRQALEMGNLTKNAELVTESLSRDIEQARGNRDENDNFVDPPFVLANSVGYVNLTCGDGFIHSGTQITLKNGESSTTYRPEQIEGRLSLVVDKNGEVANLLDKDTVLQSICFKGFDYGQIDNNTRNQPFVMIEFAITNPRTNLTKAIRTAISGRAYF